MNNLKVLFAILMFFIGVFLSFLLNIILIKRLNIKNINLISFSTFRKFKNSKQKDYIIFFIFEVLTGVFLGIIFLINDIDIFNISISFSIILLFYMAIVDYKTKYVYYSDIFLLFIFSLLSFVFNKNIYKIFNIYSLIFSIIFFGIIYLFFYDFFGFGDVLTFLVISLYFEIQEYLILINICFFISIIYGIFLKLKNKNDQRIPLIVFISLSFLFMSGVVFL